MAKLKSFHAAWMATAPRKEQASNSPHDGPEQLPTRGIGDGLLCVCASSGIALNIIQGLHRGLSVRPDEDAYKADVVTQPYLVQAVGQLARGTFLARRWVIEPAFAKFARFQAIFKSVSFRNIFTTRELPRDVGERACRSVSASRFRGEEPALRNLFTNRELIREVGVRAFLSFSASRLHGEEPAHYSWPKSRTLETCAARLGLTVVHRPRPLHGANT